MSFLDDLLAKKDNKLRFDDLDPDEMSTLLKMAQQAEATVMTVEKIKQYLKDITLEIQKVLVDEPEYEYYCAGLFSRENRRHIFLKARLKNYLMLINIIEVPERARQQIEEALARVPVKETNV